MKPVLPSMPDVQGRRDLRELPIQRVGVTSLRYPVRVMVDGQLQATVGHWTLDVALAAEQKVAPDRLAGSAGNARHSADSRHAER